jgi:hypothetical protein
MGFRGAPWSCRKDRGAFLFFREIFSPSSRAVPSASFHSIARAPLYLFLTADRLHIAVLALIKVGNCCSGSFRLIIAASLLSLSPINGRSGLIHRFYILIDHWDKAKDAFSLKMSQSPSASKSCLPCRVRHSKCDGSVPVRSSSTFKYHSLHSLPLDGGVPNQTQTRQGPEHGRHFCTNIEIQLSPFN